MITQSKPIRSLVQDKTDHSKKCLLLEQQITGLVSSTSLTDDAHSVISESLKCNGTNIPTTVRFANTSLTTLKSNCLYTSLEIS